MAAVALRSVEKFFGDLQVIHGVSLDIGDSEFLVLVGPSGCGKSTLLRMIAGLEPISAGEIAIGGRVVNGVAPKDRDVAMVFQNYALYPHKTVYDNMAFGLKLRGVKKALIDERVRKAAETLALTAMLGRYPRQLSGGQRQRVAMGRAIVRNAQVFLFDEPLSNLDAKLRVHMRTEIKSLHQDLRTTSIYVTHDQVEAMTLADRIVVLNEGRVEQVGTPLELYDRPANLFVAGFIGSPAMNLVEGVLHRNGAGARIEASGVALPAPPEVGGRDGQPVMFGVRPGDLVLGGGNGAAVSMTVDVVEPTGSETLVFGIVADTKLCVVTTERVDLRRGEVVAVSPLPSAVHVFDAETGRRL